MKVSASCRACKTPVSAAGPANPNWRGGQTRHNKGYIMERITGRGYVMVHRLMMEEHLGRLLFPDETVHHKNGVRDDNRLENLELWVTAQPAGQRPEDLVVWAREILDRYGPHVYATGR